MNSNEHAEENIEELSQQFQSCASIGGGDNVVPQDACLLSSAEATTQYSSSESSSGPDNLNGMDSSSLLDALAQSRQSVGERSSGVVSQEGKAQICFDFTKGVCSRGDKCKYSHDLATIVHFNSKEKGICFDYLRNQCHRGLLCRFSHDLSNIAQQCQVHNNSAKENKGTKPNAICYDFVKGVCQRGLECRYSHDLSLIARMARGGSAQPKAGEVCYDYLRGRCNRGATCKYSHNISFLAAPGFMGPDGTPMPAQGPGGPMSGGGAPMMGMQMGGGQGYMGSGMGMQGMPARPLHTAMSADHATFNHALAAAGGHGVINQMLAAQAAMHHSHGMAAAEAAAAEGDRRRRSSASMTGDDTMSVNDNFPPGHFMGGPNRGLTMAQAQEVMQRMAFSQMGPMPSLGMQGSGGPPGGEGMMGPMYGRPQGMRQYGGQDAGMRRPPLPPSQMPAEFAAMLAGGGQSGGMHDNQAYFAETLAAAKAQMQAHGSRMGSSGGGHMPHSMSNGGASPQMSAAPQPIPGRDGMMGPQSYDLGNGAPYGSSNGGSQSGGGAPPMEAGHLSRSAPSGGPVNPDLLPMIKEIWSKNGQIPVA